MLSGLAVVLGVMFVAGAFVVTDTLGRSFDRVFTSAYKGTDVGVAAEPKAAVSEMEGEQVDTPVPASLLPALTRLGGAAKATGVVSADGARVIGSDGKVVTSYGPPRLGENWAALDDQAEMRAGRGPRKDDEIAINEAVARAGGLHVGDRVGVLTQEPKRTFTLVGVFGYGGGRDRRPGGRVHRAGRAEAHARADPCVQPDQPQGGRRNHPGDVA